MSILNAFVSSTKVFISRVNCVRLQFQSVHPQHKTCSSLVMNMFVGSYLYLEVSSRDYLVGIAMNAFAFSVKSYLEVSSRHYLVGIAMSAFVCSVKSYLEVSSGDYLVARDKRVSLLFGSWFRNPPKRTETRN